MEKNSKPRLFIPVTVTVQGKDPADLMLPADSPAAKKLFATAKDLGRHKCYYFYCHFKEKYKDGHADYCVPD